MASFMLCVDPPDMASLSSWSFTSTFSFTGAGTLSPSSFSCFSVCVLAPVMVISCFFPVPLSIAATERMPFASISNFTSICGTPRGAGGIPSNRKLPRDLTLISTLVCPSAAVENTSDFEVGSVVFLGIIFVITPPNVSKPRDNGVTSRRTTSFTSPAKTPPCRPKRNNFIRINSNIGILVRIRVDPPTRITSSRSLTDNLASLKALLTGVLSLSPERKNLLSGELLADGRAVELDVAILVPDDAVRDLLGLVVDLGHLAADEALDGEEGVLGINDRLALGNLPHEPLAGLGVRDDGGRGARALGVGDDRRLAALHGGDGGVGGAKVDPHHLLASDPQRGATASGCTHPHRRQPPANEEGARRGGYTGPAPAPVAEERRGAARGHCADLGAGE
ncbi:hypothetical protein U9M48_036293 [Paspalum notatum var. saurae]|uniref:Uncharacterized protein n=1 Tax=Paspalum notatum var. saurae TaxID=547442 RepID=A0AAQ3UEW6_PASNO